MKSNGTTRRSATIDTVSPDHAAKPAMKIYTRTGDAGITGLYGGGRAPKNDPRIAAYGTVDELNAFLGVCRAAGLPGDVDEVLARLQHDMFALGAELASPDGAAPDVILLDGTDVADVEA